jgi:DNA-binding IclR family transcriptional regulator
MKTLPVGESQAGQSLGRVLDVLSLFSAERAELSLSEIAELLEWPIPTAHRVAATLVEREFLARDPRTKRFRLGLGVVRLVAPLLPTFQLPELAQPHLRALAEETGETAHVAVLDGRDTLHIASHPGTFRLRVEAAKPGSRLPANCTALGKCLLAQLDPQEARRRLAPEPYPARTKATARTWPQLAPRLERARADGYALSIDEFEPGLVACAVPVAAGEGVVAAMNLAAPASRVSPEAAVKLFVPKLHEAAVAIAGAHGEAA